MGDCGQGHYVARPSRDERARQLLAEAQIEMLESITRIEQLLTADHEAEVARHLEAMRLRAGERAAIRCQIAKRLNEVKEGRA